MPIKNSPSALQSRSTHSREPVGVTLRVFGAVARPIQAFLQREAASGVLLLGSALVALLWANLHAASYAAALGFPFAVRFGETLYEFTVNQFINDGLMAIFFFVVGMEIKRELVTGELNTLGKATLPAVAALGGMVLPAGIYLALNRGGEGVAGWGIPMATDIAFCVGILSLLRGRVSHALIVFVTALAIFDDIGGILVIAIFYGHGLQLPWLGAAAGVALAAFAMNRAYVLNGLAWAFAGGALWFALHHAGIHATIAGVVLGLMIPARPQRSARDVLGALADHVAKLDRNAADEELGAVEILSIEEKLEDLQAPVQRYIHLLHPFVAFFIMPLFALANSGLALGNVGLPSLLAPVALGTAAGLFIGKQVGVFLCTLLAVKLGLAPMPGGSSVRAVYGISVISGVGFTVALFIAGLAFPDSPVLLEQAKLGILIASLAAGMCGYALLRLGAPLDERAPGQASVRVAASD